MKILIAPAHTTIEYQKGSEALSIYLLLNALDKLGISFTAIVGERPEYVYMKHGRIIQVGKHENLLEFHIKVQLTTLRIIAKDGASMILHHMLPFSFQYGVNICIALKDIFKINSAVIGPITYPVMRPYIDELIVAGQKPSYLTQFLASKRNFLTRFLHMRTLYNADVILFDSRKTLNLFKNTHGSIAEYHVVYLPIDVDRIPFRPTILDKDYITLASIGSLRFIKRHDLFLMLVKYLRVYEGMNVKGYIIGWGPLKDYLLKLIRRLNLEGIVMVKSFKKRDDMIKFIAKNVDIVVLFSESEGILPTSMREAMAMGKVVVMRDVGAADEFIVNGVNGYLFNDFWEAVEIIKKLSPRDIRRIVINARKYVESTFSPKLSAERLVKIYERINPEAIS